jgi:hypothetical protein
MNKMDLSCVQRRRHHWQRWSGFVMGALVSSVFWLTIGNFRVLGNCSQLQTDNFQQTSKVAAGGEASLRKGNSVQPPGRLDSNDSNDSERLSPNNNTVRIWTFYHDINILPPATLLNLRTWRHHNPNVEIVVVSDKTIEQYIPDLPEEFFRLYPAAKSDAFRAAIIYNQGGFYADLDFLMMDSISSMVDLLQTNEIVSYTSSDDPTCHESFSSNFHGGIRGNSFSAIWWENIKDKISRVCDAGEMTADKVCCHAKDNPDPQECHVPWAFLEHLKLLDHDRPESGEFRNRTSTRACLTGDRSFQVDLVGVGAELFLRPWPYNYDGMKCHRVRDDLYCTTKTYESRTVRKFFRRDAYHLFFSSCSNKSMGEEELLGGFRTCIARALGFRNQLC